MSCQSELELFERCTRSVQKSAESFQLGDHDQALEEAFKELDVNGNGTIDRPELQTFMEAAVKHVGLEVEPEVVDAAVDALIEDAGGEDKNNCITRSQFFDIFDRHPELLTAFKDEETMSSLQQSVRSRELTVEELAKIQYENEQAWHHARTAWKNRGIAIVWLILYFGANIAAFTYKAVSYSRNDEATAVFGNCILVARGGAQALNLNACLILLPMCRHFLTRVRATCVRFLFPFDASLEFHILVGAMIALFSTAHFAAHMCDFARFANADEDDIYALFGDKLGPIPESQGQRWALLLQQRAGVTGVIMVVCMLVAFPTLFTRRTRFNLFWYTHHLLLVMLIALCIHGTGNLLEPFQSVYWLCGPLFLYCVPRLYREVKCSSPKVLDVKIKEGGVVALRLEKPPMWKDCIQAGMYGFLNIPQVSRFEWHPFTLTSAPSDDYIEFHFRRAGDWTDNAHDLFKNIADEFRGSQVHQSDDSNSPLTKRPSQPVVKVEGPIGASSQGFSDYPVIVLIGAGIGITPMISVLKMLLAKPGKMKRTFFYWTVRNRSNFEWFSSVMDDIYDSDQENVLQVRHFLTSVKEDDRDLGAVLLHHATRALHRRTDIDLLLGTRTHHQVEVGRPDWDEELTSVQEEAKELGLKNCGIFFCGPEKMADSIREASVDKSSDDGDVHFYFTKETF